jgi:hypothetical protein
MSYLNDEVLINILQYIFPSMSLYCSSKQINRLINHIFDFDKDAYNILKYSVRLEYTDEVKLLLNNNLVLKSLTTDNVYNLVFISYYLNSISIAELLIQKHYIDLSKNDYLLLYLSIESNNYEFIKLFSDMLARHSMNLMINENVWRTILKRCHDNNIDFFKSLNFNCILNDIFFLIRDSINNDVIMALITKSKFSAYYNYIFKIACRNDNKTVIKYLLDNDLIDLSYSKHYDHFHKIRKTKNREIMKMLCYHPNGLTNNKYFI